MKNINQFKNNSHGFYLDSSMFLRMIFKSWMLSFVIFTFSCDDEYNEIPAFSWEGKYVRFATDHEDAEICGGTLQYIDNYTGALKSLFKSPTYGKIDYYWLREPLDTYGPYLACQTDSSGCAYGPNALSKHLIHEHEIVHAVRGLDGISPPPLLEEGAAIFWGNSLTERPLHGSIRDIIDLDFHDLSGAQRSNYYYLAGHFVSFLVYQYGIERFIEISKMLRFWEQDRKELDMAFLCVYGGRLEDVIEEYETHYSFCDPKDFLRPVIRPEKIKACENDGISLSILPDFDCSDKDVLGPNNEGFIWTYATVELPKTGMYKIFTTLVKEGYFFWRIPDVEGAYVEMKKIEDGCSSSFSTLKLDPVPRIGDISFWGTLEKGEYLFRFVRPIDEDINISLAISCDEAEETTLEQFKAKDEHPSI